MKRAVLAALLMGSTLLGTSALALTAEQTVQREVVVRNADGSETIKLEKADKVTPGEKIVYSLNYYNDKDKPAENIVLVMPIPGEIKMVEGSAEQQGVVTNYSVDGGNSFANRADLVVELADKSTRTAQAEDITHIRWAVDSIDPGERGALVYKGLLK